MAHDTHEITQHLEALHAQLKSAAEKDYAEAKTAVQAAAGHIDEARKKLMTHVSGDDPALRAHAQETVKKLDEIMGHITHALEAAGAKFKSQVQDAATKAKGALESHK